MKIIYIAMFAFLSLNFSHTFASCPAVKKLRYDEEMKKFVGTDIEGNTWAEYKTNFHKDGGGLTSKIEFSNVIAISNTLDSPLLTPYDIYCNYSNREKLVGQIFKSALTLRMVSPANILNNQEWKKITAEGSVTLWCEKSEKTKCSFLINVTYCPSPGMISYDNKQRAWAAEGLNGDNKWFGKVTQQNTKSLTIEGTVPDGFITFLGATISVTSRGNDQPPLYPKIFCYYTNFDPANIQPKGENIWKHAYFGEERGNDKEWLRNNAGFDEKSGDDKVKLIDKEYQQNLNESFERYLDFATRTIILSPQNESDIGRHKPPVNLIDEDYSGVNTYGGNNDSKDPKNIWRLMKYEKNGKLILACFNSNTKFCPVILLKKISTIADKSSDQKNE
ncbi:MAG: hypothetical protein K0R14_1929 [Burkholderiales bacterium]|jgi:hypothetical protein|nr:hypothetical protein [Burkholderiales bacterium]